MEAPSIIALIIILGLGFMVSERSKEKSSSEASQKTRDRLTLLVNELRVDGISDELIQWLEVKIRIQTGKDGLAAYTEELRDLASKDGKQAAVVQLMLLQQRHLEERQNTEERMQWHSYIGTFRQMNKTQQKHEIERLKSVAKSDSTDDNEKLNSLELIYLSGDNKTTDVLVGGVKLFTLKEK